MSSIPKRQKAVVCAGPNQSWTVLTDHPVPVPGPCEVLIKVIAVGLCGGDSVLRGGGMSVLNYPVVAGHEIVRYGDGTLGNELDSAGMREDANDVTTAGREIHKDVRWTAPDIAHATALTRDGGLTEYTVAHHTALVPYPDRLPSLQAPLLCAGLTCFNALRHTRAKPGDSVLIIGCGGLGHVAIPLARALGLRPIVISRTDDKRKAALDLGAESYISTSSIRPDTLADEIVRIVDDPFGGAGTGPGGVNVVLQTAPEEETLKRTTGALAMDAEVLLLGEPESMRIDLPLMPFLLKRASIRGWTAGVPTDAHETLRFCVQAGVRCTVQTTKLDSAEDAYTNMGAARFRTVVVVDPEEIQKEKARGLE